MKQSREILTGPLCIALLAAAFCIWSAFGNAVNFCAATGCLLYQDFTVGGISLWWLGTGSFAALSLLGDICLLLLMALTAPCVSCLVAAVFFALTYLTFRQAEQRQARVRGIQPRRSVLLLVWLLLFTVNVGAVARAQTTVWPITEGAEDACPSCREGVNILSGHVDVAFYPLAENDNDVYRTAQMRRLLDTGMSLADALAQSLNVAPPRGFAALSPDLLWLRFRMLRNKAHVFSAGAQTVPFFEYHGLPGMLVQARQDRQPASSASSRTDSRADMPASSARDDQNGAQAGQDATLPLDPQVAGQCGGASPCP